MTEYTPATLVAAAVRHMLQQGRPAYEAVHTDIPNFKEISCRYLVPETGLRCALGGLVPPDSDTPLAYAHFSEVLNDIIGYIPGHGSAIRHAASRIQWIHDEWARRTEGLPQQSDNLAGMIRDLDRFAPTWRQELGDDLAKFEAMVGFSLAPVDA